MKYIINWTIITLAIFLSAEILEGIKIDSFYTAFVVAVVWGIINTFLKPLLLVLTLPINIFTLGLFTLVINAGLVLLTAKLVNGFEVVNFWWAILFSFSLSIIQFVLHKIGRE